MARHVFVVDTEGEPCANWLNPWNLIFALAHGAPGGKPYEAAEITDQLSDEALREFLAATSMKTRGFKS